jgi:uncharacterized membrane protein YozB (DUF420 family)
MRQQAPRGITILIAAILVVIGVLGTFLNVFPAIGSFEGVTIGIVAYVAATIVMLGGIFIRGL